MNTESTFKIVAFGDSITCGACATSDDKAWLGVFTHLLSEFFPQPVEVINKSLGDNTISPRTTNYQEASKPSALERVQNDVIDLNPDLAIVAFGLNDMRFGTPVDVFAEDLEQTILKIKGALPEVKLIATNVFHMTGFDRYVPRDRGSIALTKDYNQAIKALAEKHAIALSDASAAMDFNDQLIVEDGVHGNDLAHCIIGNRVFETAVQLLRF